MDDYDMDADYLGYDDEDDDVEENDFEDNTDLEAALELLDNEEA